MSKPARLGSGKGASEVQNMSRPTKIQTRVIDGVLVRLCCTCGTEKPLADFPVNKRDTHGRTGHCRECSNARYRESRREQAQRWHARHPGYGIEQHRRFSAAHPGYNLKYRQGHRPESRARSNAMAAKRRGALNAPEACQGCGLRTALDMHHPDYSKPLDVVWLCRKCHRRAHLKGRAVLSLKVRKTIAPPDLFSWRDSNAQSGTGGR